MRDLPAPPRYTRRVNALRRILFEHRRSAAWLIAAALLMRLLIPTGYMLAVSPVGMPTIVMCSGFGAMMPRTAAPTMHHGDHPASGVEPSGHEHGEQEGAAKELPCAFAGVATAALAATDPLLLAIALFFILAAAFRLPVRSPVAVSPFLRPPLRGPPLTA